MAAQRTRCDCTVTCGDDPWLKDGRAAPCAYKAREDAELAAILAKQQRVAQLLKLTGCKDSLEALEELARLKGINVRGNRPARGPLE